MSYPPCLKNKKQNFFDLIENRGCECPTRLGSLTPAGFFPLLLIFFNKIKWCEVISKFGVVERLL